MTASLTTASFVIPKIKKKLDYDYTDKFETPIETLLLITSLRRLSSRVCLPSLLAILI